MPGKNAYSITFSDTHDQMIDAFTKEARVSRSEAIRILLDEAIWASQEIGSQYLKMKKDQLQSEIRKIDKQIEAREKAKSEMEESSKSQSARKTSVAGNRLASEPRGFVDKRANRSEEQVFLKAAACIARDEKGAYNDLKAKFLAQAEKHPDWVAKIQQPLRAEVERLLNVARYMRGDKP